jgi:FkbH-like protein
LIKLAIVGGSSLSPLHELIQQFLCASSSEAELAEVFLGDYDNYVTELLQPSGMLDAFRPDVILIIPSNARCQYQGALTDARDKVQTQAVQSAQELLDLAQVAHERTGAEVILANFLPTSDFDPGPFRVRTLGSTWSFRKLVNLELGLNAPAYVRICDVEFLASWRGTAACTDARMWFQAKQLYSPEFSVDVAREVAGIIASLRRPVKKVLALDLDNTLWGGVIGDDGVAGIALGHGEEGEAYVALHRYVKALKDRGIILAVCSKNEHETAASVFREHPDCVLKLEDFAVFTANWGNKADNIRDIAATLNIGLDSLVFVDDNPMERDLVRQHLPEVEVIDLPEACSGYVEAIARSGWFEAASFSAEDSARGQYYAENAQRAAVRSDYVDLPSYLRGLAMQGALGGADPFHLPRIAQLINKSNQFHLTGTRYSEAELKAIAMAPDCVVRHLRLSDRFGDNGLIASVVLRRRDRTMLVDTWVMSCRVLGRTVEEFIVNDIRSIALQRGCERVVGRYVRSAKNGLVEGLYERLGFTCASRSDEVTEWTFELGADVPAWTTWVQPLPTREGMAA